MVSQTVDLSSCIHYLMDRITVLGLFTHLRFQNWYFCDHEVLKRSMEKTLWTGLLYSKDSWGKSSGKGGAKWHDIALLNMTLL